VKAAHRQNQKGGSSNQNPPKSAPNLNLQLQKCYNCGQTGHKSTNCGFQQQQQQQAQCRGRKLKCADLWEWRRTIGSSCQNFHLSRCL
ncbi:MAG: hypothetical protein GY821_15395, partial [Gammaproteobacteria bacterium]|nr:hypothetical protein [Gammaproteobacteria bacterium]